MEKEYLDRINNPSDLKKIIGNVCGFYKIEGFQNYEIITIGYEDLNIKLETISKNYLLKIFSRKRTKEEINHIVHILEEIDRLNIQSYPTIYKVGNKILNNYGGNYFVLIDWIEGDNLYNSKYKLNQEEIKILIQKIIEISKLEGTNKNIFDSWACVNFEKVYLENKRYFNNNFINILEEVNNTFKRIPFKDLPQGFIHGDVIPSNVVKNKEGDFFIIDYSVAGYYPRIQEFAVFVANMLFDEDFNQYKKNYDLALNEYRERMKLNDLEIDILPHYIKLAFGMVLLGALKEKFRNKNISSENEFFLKRGIEGLKIVNKLCLI